MITLTDKKGREIQLSDHLVWVNWGQYSPIGQSQNYSIDGSFIVESTTKKAGMPITLSAAPNEGLKYRKDVDPLNKMMLENIDTPMVLKMHDKSTYDVLFSCADGAPIQAIPLIPYADPISSDYIGLTLRFIVVEKEMKE